MKEERLRRLLENEQKLLDLRRVTKDLEDRRVLLNETILQLEKLEAAPPQPRPEDHDPAD